jgi:sulfoxide reductase heme-binding subunit YedZ
MQSLSAYIISIGIAFIFLLLAAFISTSIKFEGGSMPKDAQKRKTWFWVLALLNPVVIFLMGYYVFKPDANVMIVNKYITALGIGTAVGFFVYIIAGFVLSRVFKNGKIGHWF